ncbi:leucine-rich repeat domain-containing protein [Legionella quinlivanii]|uniref:hypothetical protein n=1 Tax=Legionella quinlivanii TaxID=45073 RepID=UPI002243F23C|nr:hypothetical protein [Legionella quinlivanii]MCW8451708.1 hypothetical protein [Legionella quinlivanii]
MYHNLGLNYDRSIDDVVAELEGIDPEEVKQLSIDSLDSSLFSYEDLLTISQKAPGFIEGLDISNLNPNKFDLQKLGEFFSQLPEQFLKIGINIRGLKLQPIDKVCGLITSLASTAIHHLELSDNATDEMNIDGINEESFFDRSPEEIIKMARSLPPHIHSLALVKANIHSGNYRNLILFLQNLPETVTSLDLSENLFDNLNFGQILRILASIPKQVTSLKLCNNNLGRFSRVIALLCDVLPKNLIKLDLSFNDFAGAFINLKPLEQLCKLKLAGNNYEALHYRALRLRFQGLPARATQVMFCFSHPENQRSSYINPANFSFADWNQSSMKQFFDVQRLFPQPASSGRFNFFPLEGSDSQPSDEVNETDNTVSLAKDGTSPRRPF